MKLRTDLKGNHRETANMLGISQQALTKAVNERECPVLRRGARGSPSVYDWASVIRWRMVDIAPTELERSQTRRLSALAEKTESENSARRKQLASASDVRREWRALVREVTAAVGDLPEKLAPRLVSEPNTEVIAGFLRSEIDAVLTAIADGKPR